MHEHSLHTHIVGSVPLSSSDIAEQARHESHQTCISFYDLIMLVCTGFVCIGIRVHGIRVHGIRVHRVRVHGYMRSIQKCIYIYIK